MLEIVQTGQFGKTSLLFDMHRLRKRVFKDRMGWEVSIDTNGLEVDQFDLPETIYVLALDNDRRVIGNWRLLPTIGPTMIRDIWPKFLDSIYMPSDPCVWEASRFAVDSLKGGCEEGLYQVHQATQELFCGVTELCLLCGIKQIFAMYDERIAKILKRIDCEPFAVSTRLKVADTMAEVGAFATDQSMLSRLRAATGINNDLVTPRMIPPLLQIHHKKELEKKRVYKTQHLQGGRENVAAR